MLNVKKIKKSKSSDSDKSPKADQPTKPKKTESDKSSKNKSRIYLVCGAVAALSLGVIVAVLVAFFTRPTITEETFATNDTQSSISLTPTSSNKQTGSTLVETHVVYEYDGDNVIGLKTYFEYTDAEAAKAAYEARKDQPEFKDAVVEDKYIVVAADPEQFKGLTADDVRQQTEAIRQFQASQNPDSDNSDKSDDSDDTHTSDDHSDDSESADDSDDSE